MVSLALYQPDIPQNVGAAIRLCACLGIDLHIIEPCGFPMNDRKIKQAGMDYLTQAKPIRHESWQTFNHHIQPRRLVLMTTKTDQSFIRFQFQSDDILLAGRESAGVPQEVHEAVDYHITIPMAPPARSLNVINASAMILGEAMRQTEGYNDAGR
jgi:tRNA (cytidine/uridine-2'-O-)-methyltransferase